MSPSYPRNPPAFQVRVNKKDLPPAAKNDLLAVAVLEDVFAPGMFTLRLLNWDPDKQEVTWSDDKLFAEGNEVEIGMGYVDHVETLMVGEITGLEPEFAADEPPLLTVRGYDRRHRLTRGRRTRSFTKMKDSEIAGKVAREAGLTGKADDTKTAHDYVLQHNQTDLEFLLDRAARIGHEVVVEDKTLFFRKHKNTGSEAVVLTRERDLVRFEPRLTSMPQVAEVAVQGWDPKAKKGIVGRAKVGDEVTTMGGKKSGAKVTKSAFKAPAAVAVDRPVVTQAEADQIAKGSFNDMALAYVSGDGECVGRTDLRAGTLVKVEGLGRRFSGLYYVSSTRHRYSPRRGYQTEFSVRRNAT